MQVRRFSSLALLYKEDRLLQVVLDMNWMLDALLCIRLCRSSDPLDNAISWKGTSLKN